MDVSLQYMRIGNGRKWDIASGPKPDYSVRSYSVTVHEEQCGERHAQHGAHHTHNQCTTGVVLEWVCVDANSFKFESRQNTKKSFFFPQPFLPPPLPLFVLFALFRFTPTWFSRRTLLFGVDAIGSWRGAQKMGRVFAAIEAGTTTQDVQY